MSSFIEIEKRRIEANIDLMEAKIDILENITTRKIKKLEALEEKGWQLTERYITLHSDYIAFTEAHTERLKELKDNNDIDAQIESVEKIAYGTINEIKAETERSVAAIKTNIKECKQEIEKLRALLARL